MSHRNEFWFACKFDDNLPGLLIYNLICVDNFVFEIRWWLCITDLHIDFCIWCVYNKAHDYNNDLVQYCSNFIAKVSELLQSCAKPSTWYFIPSCNNNGISAHLWYAIVIAAWNEIWRRWLMPRVFIRCLLCCSNAVKFLIIGNPRLACEGKIWCVSEFLFCLSHEDDV